MIFNEQANLTMNSSHVEEIELLILSGKYFLNDYICFIFNYLMRAEIFTL